MSTTTRHPFRYSSRPATSYIPTNPSLSSHKGEERVEGRLEPCRRRQVSISSSSTSTFTAPSNTSDSSIDWKKPGYSLELLNTPALLNDAGIFRSKSAEPFSSTTASYKPRVYKPSPTRLGNQIGTNKLLSSSEEDQEVNILSTIYSDDDDEVIREARFPSLPNEILSLGELSRQRFSRSSGEVVSGVAAGSNAGASLRRERPRHSLELNTQAKPRYETPLANSTKFFTSNANNNNYYYSNSSSSSKPITVAESMVVTSNQLLKERIQGAVGSALIVERGLSLVEQQHGIPVSALLKENGVIITLLTDVLFHLCNSEPSTPLTTPHSAITPTSAGDGRVTMRGSSGGGVGVMMEKRRWI